MHLGATPPVVSRMQDPDEEWEALQERIVKGMATFPGSKGDFEELLKRLLKLKESRDRGAHTRKELRELSTDVLETIKNSLRKQREEGDLSDKRMQKERSEAHSKRIEELKKISDEQKKILDSSKQRRDDMARESTQQRHEIQKMKEQHETIMKEAEARSQEQEKLQRAHQNRMAALKSDSARIFKRREELKKQHEKLNRQTEEHERWWRENGVIAQCKICNRPIRTL